MLSLLLTGHAAAHAGGHAVGRRARHRHAAEEVYIVISGTAAWARGEAAEALRPPGSVIHHPPWMSHGMRTAEEPLLALYLWSGGDLTQKSEMA